MSTSNGRNPGLTIHTTHRRVASTTLSPIHDGFSEIALPTSTSNPEITAGPSDAERIFLPSPVGPSPLDETPFRPNFDNALEMCLTHEPLNPLYSSTSTNPLPLSDEFTFPDFSNTEYSSTNQFNANFGTEMLLTNLDFASRTAGSANGSDSASELTPAMLLERLHSGNSSREGSPSEMDSSPSLSVAPSALHTSPILVEPHTEETSGVSQQYSEMKAYGDGYNYSVVAGMMQSLSGKWIPGESQEYGYPTSNGVVDVHMVDSIEYQPQVNLYDQATFQQGYPQMEYPNYPTAASSMNPSMTINPNYAYVPRMPTLSASHQSSPSISTQSSPLISRAHHQRAQSTSSVYSNMLSPATLPLSIAPSMISHRGALSNSDEEPTSTSGSSAYGHSRHASTSTSVGMTVGQWADSYNPGLGKSIDGHLSHSFTFGTSTTTTTTAPSQPSTSTAQKKRKRASHVPQQSISNLQSLTLSEESSVDEEDEYVGSVDSESEDEFAEGRKSGKKGRVTKKRRTTPDSEGYQEDHHHSPAQCRPKSTHAACKDDYGATVKVDVLIPITRSSKSCPHCGFVPSNGRFSDLKRHHAKHLVDDGEGKDRWVCVLCGDIREEETVDEQSGEYKVVRVYYPKVGLASACKKYTRKDSAKRHWVKEHGDKGVEWWVGHLTTVDVVREED